MLLLLLLLLGFPDESSPFPHFCFRGCGERGDRIRWRLEKRKWKVKGKAEACGEKG